ncbi:DegT/DnrJ/EryC1/StrS family aminotransferase [Aminobacterium mobile]|jgi:dTDP-4-amino-4,6-dideoxygalactose transaminase|uniref:DegT/DnrJ/EryC1/StrS family aminotransferase n=1 Tax=Aminobacterium mobile TaxID=81467 RepID=UPI000465F42C|nr:DegT/DnrJ/EryC1/StrS family aminotransferase [Aminobacterium mobile]
MKIPTLDLTRNYERIREEVADALEEVLESQYFILGPVEKAFEEEISAYLGGAQAIGCASGSDALLLALMALDVSEGDEVITTPYSFFATVSCITRLGAKPVFVDIDPDTYNINLEQLMDKVTSRTKAIIPVHLFGQMAPLEEVSHELESRGIAIVEDAAQAFGSWRQVEGEIIRAGAWGSIGCYSFFPTKNLGGYGDGGMVVSSRSDLAARLRTLRVHGAGTTYIHEEVGLNSRLDALQAAILRVKLRHLDEWNEERRLVADRYNLLFAEHDLLENVKPPKELKGNYHIYHQYVPRVNNRSKLSAFLEGKGITTRVYYPLCLHLQQCFGFLGYKEGDFPEAEKLSHESLAFPIFPELTVEEQEYIVGAAADFYAKK